MAVGPLGHGEQRVGQQPLAPGPFDVQRAVVVEFKHQSTRGRTSPNSSKCSRTAASNATCNVWASTPSCDAICAEIEAEISELEEDEKKMFLEDLGLTESGLEKLIAASYRLLGLMSFLTAGEDETRAWTIKVGTKAPQAAGKIHTDFERGFIRAETIRWDELLELGSWSAARDAGKLRIEGKDYVVADGDVMEFRFNV